MIHFESNRSDKREYLYSTSNTDLNFPRHLHRSFELNYLLSGELLCEVDGHKFSIKAGEGILILPGQIHSFQSRNPNRSVLFIFSNDWVADFYSEMQGSRFLPPVCHLDGGFADILRSRETNRYRIKSVLYELCSRFYETCPRVRINEADFALTNAIAVYIEEHYQERITLTGMAEALGYNHCYLSGFFNRHFGMGFSAYVNGYRLQYAREYLRSSDRKITEIASLCGFDSIRNFNRTFRQETGQTPNEYRRHHTGS